ncbi:2-dehydro-3-deoxygalactonokinase [uncultured Martelella sp.]|uniref:2-dehydro-3-deoxygalactonokinase n=1 Tax=uncultured Martelella sp. TaxID=392331 RepID=UPI0029C61F23|nr:2-dehydro-3-deoxygalactonokinase [uncultured Martelella sp.]
MTGDAKGGQASLIALDWGTSALRAYLMDCDGAVLDARSNNCGIQNLPQPGEVGFEKAFSDIRAGWPEGLPVIAGGMVGSAQGWKEAPYILCPADFTQLADASVRVTTAIGEDVVIAPGMICRPGHGQPDVMRGEEIQIAGALAQNPKLGVNAEFLLPGTHSKWVRVSRGRVVDFTTYMTGELFSVLARHSILGRLMSETPAERNATAAAFVEGVAASAAEPDRLQHLLFGVRTRGLTGDLAGNVLSEYLSGLLIGNEMAAGLGRRTDPDAPLILIGEQALCDRYQKALRVLGGPPAEYIDDASPSGLYLVARKAGLLKAASLSG